LHFTQENKTDSTRISFDVRAVADRNYVEGWIEVNFVSNNKSSVAHHPFRLTFSYCAMPAFQPNKRRCPFSLENGHYHRVDAN
jgi:hypothetical protein